MAALGKLLAYIGVIGALVFGALFALATFVDTAPRETSLNVTADKFMR